MKELDNETPSFYIVPKKSLDEIAENQRRIIDLLTARQETTNTLGDHIPESEASKLLGRKTTWFWNLRRCGKLPFTKVGNRVWYLRKDIISLLG
jgi:hypothetical protein